METPVGSSNILKGLDTTAWSQKKEEDIEIPVFVSINTSSMQFKLINMLKGARGSLLLCHIFL